jgi:hypothetical protein
MSNSLSCSRVVLRTLGLVVGWWLAFGLLASAQEAQSAPSLKLTTKLGVEATVPATKITMTDNVLQSTLCPYGVYGFDWSHAEIPTIPIRTAGGVYTVLPMDSIRDVVLQEGIHVVHLRENQDMKGLLVGIIEMADGRKYDLRTTSRVEVLSLPKEAQPKAQKTSDRVWKLEVVPSTAGTFSVVEPRFVFEYYSREGYIMGGAFRVTSTSSFYLKTREDESLANLEDFQAISFAKGKDPNTPALQMKVRSASGVETTGTLILTAGDTGTRWVLSAHLATNARVRVVLDQVPFTLTRAESK